MRPALFLVLLATAAATRLPAQATGAPDDQALLHTRLVPGGGDALRIRLARRSKYWGRVEPASAQVEFRETARSGRVALLSPVPTQGDSTGQTFELYAPGDGEYAVTAVRASGAGLVELSLWTNQDSTSAVAAARDRGLGFGLTVGAGGYSGFQPGSDYSGPFDGHAQYEAGLVVGNSGRMSLTLGAGTQRRPVQDLSLFMVFAELRGAILRRTGVGHRALEAGALLRVAQANLDRSADDPSETSLGLFLSHHLDRRQGSRGWTLGLSWLHTFIGNTDIGNAPETDQGLGWIRWVP